MFKEKLYEQWVHSGLEQNKETDNSTALLANPMTYQDSKHTLCLCYPTTQFLSATPKRKHFLSWILNKHEHMNDTWDGRRHSPGRHQCSGFILHEKAVSKGADLYDKSIATYNLQLHSKMRLDEEIFSTNHSTLWTQTQDAYILVTTRSGGSYACPHSLIQTV